MATPSKFTDEVKPLAEYFVSDSRISNIVPCPDSDSAWITCVISAIISLIDGKGDTKQNVTYSIHKYIHQLTLWTNNNLLMTSPILTTEERFNCSKPLFSAFTTFTTFHECEPRGITSVCDLGYGEKAIIGTRRHRNDFFYCASFGIKTYKNGLNSVDNQGSTIKCWIFDDGCPERLMANQKTSDRAKIAKRANSESFSVVVSFDMKKQFKYPMQSIDFLPTDEAFHTLKDHVIFDKKSNSINILNQDGLLQTETVCGSVSIFDCLRSGITLIVKL